MEIVNGVRYKDGDAPKDDAAASGKRRGETANKARTPATADTKAKPITSKDVGSGGGDSASQS